jgi:nucleoside-diphosphate-sugar epimerase
MDDAIRATIEIMEAPAERIKIRSSYNIAGISFNPEDLAKEIRNHIPEFKITYNPDSRQEIAASWPESIRDTPATEDWGWELKSDLKHIVADMLKNV